MLKALAIVGVIQASLGLVQVTMGRPLVYESQYARFYWFNPERFQRALGTLDSSLDLAMLLVIAIPLCMVFRRPLVRIIMVAILLGGVLATQSRMGTALALVGAVYVALGGGAVRGRIVMTMSLLASSIVLFVSPFGQGFITRAQNAQGSTARRAEAAAYIADNIFNHTLIGDGLNSSYALRSGSTLGSSLENGFAMYAFDFGWLPAAGLLLFFLSITALDAFRKDWTNAVSMFAAVTMVAGFSSFMTQSASGTLIFFTAGVCLALQNPRRTTESDSRKRGTAERLQNGSLPSKLAILQEQRPSSASKMRTSGSI